MFEKKKCKWIARLLTLVLILSLPGFTETVSAVEALEPFSNWTTQYVDDRNLITNVTNPSNGVLRFKLTVPAGRTATYKVELIPSERTGSIDTVSGSYTNSGTTTASKTITVNVDYYSNQYSIYASYQTGTTHEKIINEDRETAVSALKTETVSDKFIWTQEKLNVYNAGKIISWATLVGTSYMVSLQLTPLAGGGIVIGVIWSFISSGGVNTENPGEYQVDMTPRLNMSYQIRFIPKSTGMDRIITITAPDGRVSEYTLGSVSLGTITPI